MKQKLAAALLIGLMSYSCAGQANSQALSSPTSPPQIITSESANSRQRLSLRLTLSSPEDLKVREGDQVQANQILSDRLRERQRLEAQKRQLQIQIERLKAPIAGALPARPIPEVASLPPATFLDEVAEVERQRVMVRQAEAVVGNQQRMLDMLASMPSGELPEATLPHEQEVLRQKQQELDQARAEMSLSEAKLGQTQQDRQYQEYLHSLEMSKRGLSIQQGELQRQEQLQRQEEQERDRSFKLAQLETQMQQLDSQLFSLSSVRSPYSGKIQRIVWKEQNDQNLLVELTLVRDAGGSASGQGTGE
ncbi:hypothetical protein [Rivularia sp. UHCC 0363]|uniref:hypothetical protein n=1 Tax=Rivularia sp. UHCC 0363 TaxID=3110244 RepID=UPI002B213182|nr:hypothetical protein [Rivularia sp. UHCC 0363]MEA5597372.1 hypothetical protein [Rivularia sp. UHCC 0363]